MIWDVVFYDLGRSIVGVVVAGVVSLLSLVEWSQLGQEFWTEDFYIWTVKVKMLRHSFTKPSKLLTVSQSRDNDAPKS